MPVVELIERVKEFILCAALVAEELDVIDQEHVCSTILLSKMREGSAADGGDEFVGEFLGGHADHPRAGAIRENFPCDGVHEVGLAQSRAPEKKQRIISPGGILCDCPAGGGGELVVGPDDEGIEGVMVVQQANHRAVLAFFRYFLTCARGFIIGE